VYISHGAGVSQALRERRSALGAPGREPRPQPVAPRAPPHDPVREEAVASHSPRADGQGSQGPAPDVPVCVRTTPRAGAGAGAWLGLGVHRPRPRRPPGGARRFGRVGDGWAGTFGLLEAAGAPGRGNWPTARATGHFEVLDSSGNGFEDFEWRSRQLSPKCYRLFENLAQGLVSCQNFESEQS
jgi:hypothetical protein